MTHLRDLTQDEVRRFTTAYPDAEAPNCAITCDQTLWEYYGVYDGKAKRQDGVRNEVAGARYVVVGGHDGWGAGRGSHVQVDNYRGDTTGFSGSTPFLV